MTQENKFTSLSRSTLSDAGDDTYTIHGVAIGEDDVTRGKSGTKKVWRQEPLQEAADSLEGQPIVVDHENTSHSTVGKVNKTKYESGVGILYEGEIHDDELAEKIDNGLLEVSLRGHHEDVEEMSVDEETGAREPMNVVFENLSIVPSGAAPSNTVDTGEHEELAVAELAQYFEEQEDDEPEEIPFSEGDYVEWGDGEVTGIVRSVDEENEQVTVQVHTDDDNQGEASGQEISEVGFDQISSVEELEAGKPQPESETAELQDYVIHEPTYDGTTESEWNEPDLEDFTDESWEDLTEDEKTDIAEHFLMAIGQFPPERYSDLKLPVVTPEGDLSLNALQAVKGGRGVQEVEGASDDVEEAIMEMANDLANEEFDRSWGESEDEEEMGGDNKEAEGSEGREESTDELEDSDAGELEATTVFENGLYYKTNMTEEDDNFDDPVTIEREELESLREENEELSQKEETVEELNETLSELRDRQEILDEVDGDALEQLREIESPVVLSEERHEELSQEVETVERQYASELASEMPAFTEDELAENFSIEELAEKVEALEDEEEELEDEPEGESEELEPDPKSKDKSETEELEDDEELSEEETEKNEKLAELGWGEYADAE